MYPCPPAPAAPDPIPEVELKKLTPILTVESIEPSLPFWVDALGFTKTVEVPHEGALGFAIL